MKLKVQAKPERSELFDCPTWEDAAQKTKMWLAANRVSAADFISASVYDDAATHILGTITLEGLVMYTVKSKRYRPIK